MIMYRKMEEFACHLLNLLNTRIAKFKNLVAIGTNKMIVLLVFIGFLKMSLAFSKLMSGYQMRI